MRVPYTWLQEYVDLDCSAEEAASLLQQVGVPVEIIEREGADVQGVLTGCVLSVEQHPDADRLRVTRVDVGSGQPLQIVTAASNVRVGQKVAVATHGALLASGLRIKKGKLRGVVSEGMFCSATELGMDPEGLPAEQREGILDLPPATPLGRDIHQVLRLVEEVLVLETFANRPDQLSLLGIARELAARLGRPLKRPEVVPEPGAGSAGDLVELRDLAGCPRYIARVLEDVQVGPSPSWMVRRLESAGMRAVNNVVDITNYVMLETGQPLHAFDLESLAGGRVVVRRSQPGERMVTLDGDEHELPQGTLVIADAEKAVAVAGVMGGLNSEIQDTTHRILLESASFHSGDVRRASLRLGLRTESSRRFEKGMDRERVALGSERAAHLLAVLAGAKVQPSFADQGAPVQEPVEILLRPSRVRQVLGVELSPEDTVRILEALEFACTPEAGGLRVRVPSHRQDVVGEADLIEEVARHYGYDNLPVTVPHGEPRGAMPGDDAPEEWARETMARLGLTEVLTPSLHHPEILSRYRLEASPPLVMNPLSEDQRVLRPALFPSITEAVRRNMRVRNRDLCFFEISRVFQLRGEEVVEPRRLGLALSRAGAGFLDLKGVLERLGAMAGVALAFEATVLPWLHPGRAASLKVGEQELGWVGEIHPHLAGELDLEGPLALAELDLDVLETQRVRPHYRPISRFPGVERDLAFLVEESVPAGTMARRMREVGGDLVENLACFDVYRGAQVPEGHKSLAFRAALQAPDRTLTEDEIQRVLRKMIKLAERDFAGRLRE